MMMQGYDLAAAVPFIAKAMRKAGHKNPQDELEAFVRRAIEADMAYMLETGVIDEDGMMGEAYYDDDDAFEFILERMARQRQYVGQMMELLNDRLHSSSDFMGSLFDSLSPYLCTNLSRAQIVNQAWTAKDYTRLPLKSIDGVHTVGDDGYMQFLPDESSLEQVILDVFYKQLK